MPSYRNNHLLSNCLLKRFADNEGMILMQKLAGRQPMRIPVKGQGYHKRLWQRTSAEFMENLWSNQAESSMARVFQLLDTERRFPASEKRLLIRFLAIHFVRSNEFIRVYERTRETQLQALSVDSSIPRHTRYDVRLGLLRETGIPSAHFEEATKRHYEMGVEYLNGFGIEIGIATGERTFILPDGGMLLVDNEGRSQPSGGVALKEAKYAIMPLGPCHLVSFAKGRKVKYRQFSDREVELANEKLKAAVVQAFYSQP